jgi:nucleoside diphosphate kinase
VINKWKEYLGPINPNDARKETPTSIRAIYGTDHIKNACHGSNSLEEAESELKYVFESETFKVNSQ